MTKKLRRNLIKLGYDVCEGGKHYKLYYYNDNRYCITISKTPSDSRAGLNIAQEIISLTL